MSRQRTTWAVAEAKARFSKWIDRVLASGPQTLIRKGDPVVVAVPVQVRNRKVRRTGSLADFFAHSPLRGSGLEVERIQDQPRETRP